MAHTSDSIEHAVMQCLCKRIRSPFAKLISNNASAEFDYNAYESAAEFSQDYLLFNFLRKWKGWDTGVRQKAAAVSGWHTAERLCYKTNIRLNHLHELPYKALDLVSRIQRKILMVLGEHPDFEQLDPLCRWSSGATFDVKRRDGTDAALKMSSVVTVTERCVPHLHRVLDPVWKEGFAGYSIVDGNRCVTVPKDSKTDRMIAAEPTGNAFLQQGVGRFIRSRLKSFGIDLTNQKINQDLAFRAVVDELSTIDLSMASDTLSLALVAILLPQSWLDYLMDIRSPKSYLDGKWYLLEKFSSMGNAFTFELESLVFWAIASEVGRELPSEFIKVYGDDIVVPRVIYSDVCSALGYFGFTPNLRKSYKDGPFFESCGKQYYNLEDVTPIFQKEIVGKSLPELIRLHNRLYRWGKRNGMHLVRDALKLIIDFTRANHPRLRRLPSVPYGIDDRGFIQADISPNKSGDYWCYVLQAVPVVLHGFIDREVLCAYAYKLRKSQSIENSLDSGHFGLVVGEGTILKWTRVWGSAVLATAEL